MVVTQSVGMEGLISAAPGATCSGLKTTLRMLTSLLPPTSGRAEVAGADVTTHPAEVRRRIQHHIMGKDAPMPQEVHTAAGYLNVACNTLRMMTNTSAVRVYLKPWGSDGTSGAPGVELPTDTANHGTSCLCLTVVGSASTVSWSG